MASSESGCATTSSERLFVSYAREQSGIVEELSGALGAAGHPTWTDVKGLYGGETFWPEIEKAVEAAAAMIFVISRDSAASTHCLRELEHALRQHKRIVPVCVEEPPASDIPTGLASLQWIFCRSIGDVPSAAKQVITAIAGDWVWLRQHGRLLARAHEWRASNQEASRLLRGSELKHAEQWANGQPSSSDRPAPLHHDYLNASRSAQNTRIRRGWLIGVTTVVSLTAISALAWIQLIAQLNNHNAAALEKETKATNAAVLEDARRASGMCRWLPFSTAACRHADEILGVALQVNDRFTESIESLSRSIARVSPPGHEDHAQQLLLGDLLWHRSVSRIYEAESQDDDRMMKSEYARARMDFEQARQMFDRWPDDARQRALNTTAARFAIAAEDYAGARAALEKEARYAPETQLLWHLVLLCSGQPEKSIESMQKFIDGLVDGVSSPVYGRNQRFARRVRALCTN
jgi:cell division septum initiation protein DivIVA